jgi:hypothetical protein
MRNSLLRIAAIASVLYIAAGAALGIVADATQGHRWMAFTLGQWILLGVTFFTLPLLVVLWIGWVIFRRTGWRRSETALGVAAAAIPLLYVLFLVFYWVRG